MKLDVPVLAYCDNRSLVDSVYSTKSTSDKGLKIDIASIREMIIAGINRQVIWIPTQYQVADCLTKSRSSASDRLDQVLRTSNLLPFSFTRENIPL